MKGFKNKDKDFIPTEDSSKKISSSQINSSSEVDTTSKQGEKELKTEKIIKMIGKLTDSTKGLVEKEVDSRLDKHLYGNAYEFKNQEEWIILKNETDAKREAVESLENLFDEMGVLGWNKSYVIGFLSEEKLQQKLGVSYDDIYGGDHGEPNFTLAKHVPVNKSKLINESITTDGIAHSLASYDGKEVELSNGTLMYRIN